MLPGFRFLFAAVVLSLSVLMFGLGAAALLRAAHEQFASLPSRRAPPETLFARPNEAPAPMLALLRFDPPVIDKAPDDVATAVMPQIAAPAEQTSNTMPAMEPEKSAPAVTDDSKPAEAAKPVDVATPVEAVKPEISTGPTAANEAARSQEPAARNDDVKVAAIAQAPEPPAVMASPATEPAIEAPLAATSPAATTIATLGGPAVNIEDKVFASKTDAQPDRSVARKRAAHRARERRRIARRARVVRQTIAQQQTSPFGQTPAARTP